MIWFVHSLLKCFMMNLTSPALVKRFSRKSSTDNKKLTIIYDLRVDSFN